MNYPQLKIKKEFWDKIISGEKKYEFRKLSKGLESGTYEFVSIDKPIKKEVTPDNFMLMTPGMEAFFEHEVYGTAKLTPEAVNPTLHYQSPIVDVFPEMCYYYYDGNVEEIDKPTFDFVKENYIDKDIEFLAFEISEVKNGTN